MAAERDEPLAARARANAGWLAGAAGLTAVGAVAGVSVARSLGRRRKADDPYAIEDFELLDTDRSCLLTTPDGVPLAVREAGPADAPMTVVFVHGFCLGMGAFHFQRARLAEVWGENVRMVFYDHRGHGDSGEAPPETYTITQLAEDLETVLSMMAPRGPIVLVGHSMGGMTILAHARLYPARWGKRVVGAALIASAMHGLSKTPLGEVLQNPALGAARTAVRKAPKLIHRGRGVARGIIQPILQAASYGDAGISPTLVRYSDKMMHDTPIATLVEFLTALEEHDETAALPILAEVPSLIVCGGHDLLTPRANSEEMAAALPNGELVVVRGAGHLVHLEQPDIVDDALVRLVNRATPSKFVAMRRRLAEKARRGG